MKHIALLNKRGKKAHVGAHNLQHTAVNVLVSDALDVAISNLLVPNLQRFGSSRRISLYKVIILLRR